MRNLLLSCSLLIGVIDLAAQTVATIPEGYLAVQIPAGSIAAPSTTTFSLPLREHAPQSFAGQAAGRLTEVASAALSNSNAGWTPGALSQPSAPYFLRITSGNSTGRTFQVSATTANTATTVTVLTQGLDLAALDISAGDTYEIFPGDTLGSFFGSEVMGGTSTSNADVVRLHNGAAWTDYYYNSANAQWREGSVPVNRNNVVLRPDAGITFYRRGASSLSILLLGKIPHTDMRVVIRNSGATYVGNVFPFDQTLQGASFHSMGGWVTAGSVATADKVKVWNGAAYDTYHYNLTVSQWRIGSVPVNRNNAILPTGVPVIIERPGAASGATTLLRALPYNL